MTTAINYSTRPLLIDVKLKAIDNRTVFKRSDCNDARPRLSTTVHVLQLLHHQTCITHCEPLSIYPLYQVYLHLWAIESGNIQMILMNPWLLEPSWNHPSDSCQNTAIDEASYTYRQQKQQNCIWKARQGLGGRAGTFENCLHARVCSELLSLRSANPLANCLDEWRIEFDLLSYDSRLNLIRLDRRNKHGRGRLEKTTSESN